MADRPTSSFVLPSPRAVDEQVHAVFSGGSLSEAAVSLMANLISHHGGRRVHEVMLRDKIRGALTKAIGCDAQFNKAELIETFVAEEAAVDLQQRLIGESTNTIRLGHGESRRLGVERRSPGIELA